MKAHAKLHEAENATWYAFPLSPPYLDLLNMVVTETKTFRLAQGLTTRDVRHLVMSLLRPGVSPTVKGCSLSSPRSYDALA